VLVVLVHYCLVLCFVFSDVCGCTRPLCVAVWESGGVILGDGVGVKPRLIVMTYDGPFLIVEEL